MTTLKRILMRKRAVATILAVIVVFALMYAIVYLRPPSGEVYSTYYCPDGRYEVALYGDRYRLGQFVPTFRGGSGDGPGTVCLVESKSRKILKQKRVRRLTDIQVVTWSSTKVDIMYFVEWKLP